VRLQAANANASIPPWVKRLGHRRLSSGLAVIRWMMTFLMLQMVPLTALQALRPRNP